MEEGVGAAVVNEDTANRDSAVIGEVGGMPITVYADSGATPNPTTKGLVDRAGLSMTRYMGLPFQGVAEMGMLSPQGAVKTPVRMKSWHERFLQPVLRIKLLALVHNGDRMDFLLHEAMRPKSVTTSEPSEKMALVKPVTVLTARQGRRARALAPKRRSWDAKVKRET
ncbi:hypothetical protein SARC_11466 [Sphaeroforma arctica JP610]|uniref:Uncharacterized protein n=1 Tax=Sphaeroforma arctica JP610 TaxID=667725 RepID=A0A0L0FGX5_9EUKA|nr:hypothetical protein SARC_11466 [Sphaeroforma arctica JP610]KNC76022.1 hypothetical protein SARC_11466 [Sphaeroforma arctica JP610]|eukprot:XP_014149924.1 hypothetical protein SARC_11466 [Sphaeroforma arctica JP610]